MIFDLLELKNNIVDKIDVDISYSFTKEQLEGTEIRKLDDVKINGYINKNLLSEYELNLTINGEMILPCAITLKDVVYPFSIEINGEINKIIEEFNDFSKKIENSIDIFPIIWENILMEIPMKVVSEDAWKLITEDDDHEEINPELAKLKDLF